MNRVHGADGAAMAATFVVEPVHGQLTLVLHSAGGASRHGGLPRNADYAPALQILLERLSTLSATLTDAYVDSTVVAGMPLEERRLTLPGRPYPIDLAAVDDYDGLRRAHTRAQGPIGRVPTATSTGGNERKRLRLCLVVPFFEPSDADARRLELTLAALQSEPRGRPVGQGFGANAATNKAVELAAMSAATDHYTRAGWSVTDVSAHASYDLHCTKDSLDRRVEVKGTTNLPGHVLLTPSEVAHALAHPGESALYVLGSVIVTTGESGELATTGGIPLIFDPWLLETDRLTPVGYSYALDG